MIEEKTEFLTPPWKPLKPAFLVDMANSKMADTSPEISVSTFLEMVDNHRSHDVSHRWLENGRSDRLHTIIDDLAISSRFSQQSIYFFLAELKAIELALKYIEKDRLTRLIIFSDFKSTLELFTQARLDNLKSASLLHF